MRHCEPIVQNEGASSERQRTRRPAVLGRRVCNIASKNVIQMSITLASCPTRLPAFMAAKVPREKTKCGERGLTDSTSLLCASLLIAPANSCAGSRWQAYLLLAWDPTVSAYQTLTYKLRRDSFSMAVVVTSTTAPAGTSLSLS